MVSYCCVRLKPILSRIVAGTAAEGRHKIASLAERISTAGRWRGWSSSTIDVVTVGRSCVTTSRRTIVLESLGRQADTAGAMAEGPPTLHPVLHPVSFLLGTWRGEGEGGYPTIQSFKYDEEIKLWHSGKPVIAYSQKTWKAASGEPMHTESGYLRFKPDGSMEAVIAQSTGLAEVQKGSYNAEKKTVLLQSSLVGNASKVLNIGRIFEVEGDELRYTVEMAIHGHEQQPHLRAVLRKVSGD